MTTNKTAKIQFYEGTDEPVVPEIRLTRSKDGTTGQALFLFEKPQALSSITDSGKPSLEPMASSKVNAF